jgi:hypothetical protein
VLGAVPLPIQAVAKNRGISIVFQDAKVSADVRHDEVDELRSMIRVNPSNDEAYS